MPRKKVEAVVLDEELVDLDETLEASEEVQVSKVIPVNSAATFGIELMDRKNVILYERTLYKELTEIKARGKGKDRIFQRGEYGPWKLSARPYPKNLVSALQIVFEWLVNDNVQEANDLAFVIECIEAAKTDIEQTVSQLKF